MDNGLFKASLFKTIIATVIGVIFGGVIFLIQSLVQSNGFYQDIKSSVVKIISKTRVGTGFVVKLDHNTVYITTVAHVVEGDPSPTIKFFGNKEFKAQILYAESDNPDKGLALLSIKGNDIPDNVVPIYLSEKSLRNFNLDLEKRDKAIFTFGFPIGGANWAYTELIYSGQKGRDLYFSGNIQEGNSGGPLIKDNKVIGIITVKSHFVYATSAFAIKEFLMGAIDGVFYGVNSSSIPRSTVAEADARIAEAEQARLKAETEIRIAKAEQARLKAEAEVRIAEAEQARLKAETETKMVAQANADEERRRQAPVNVVRSYYADINRGDADSVISKWKSPNRKILRSLVGGGANCRVNRAELLHSSSDTAIVSLSVTCVRRWVGTIELENVQGNWKIVKLNLK